MGKTSTDVKRRYNEKAYDRFSLTFPKGKKEIYRKHAESQGTTLNAYINKLLEEDMKKSPV